MIDGESAENPVPPTAAAFVRRLRALQDARLGLPIASHRARLGRLIVASKTVFRKSFQPYINELLGTQVQFNETAVKVAEAVYRDLGSLEGGILAMRASTNRRISALEAEVRELQQELALLREQVATPRTRRGANK